MKSSFLLFTLFLCTASVFAIDRKDNSPKRDSTQSAKDSTETVAAKPEKPYQPSAPRIWEIKHTRIAISFDMSQKTAAVKEWINLHPYFYPTDTLALDAKTLKIDSVLLMSKTGATNVKYTYEKDKLKITFAKQYLASDSIMLHLCYTAMPYSAPSGGSAAITDDRGLYFINTDGKIPHKHAQIWTQGETEANSHWMITIDKPNTRFTTQIEMTVPDSFVTLSNGALVKTIKGTKGMHTDIWKMDMPIQAYAVMMATGNFSIIKDHWKNKEVNYYVEPEFAPYAKKMFDHTPEMIEFYSKITGVPYPWNKYSQVVVRDYVSGAMENTSASLFGEFMNSNNRELADNHLFLESVVAHELFHQWFGDYVTCESWSNITVNESFANYSEQLWIANYYGKDEGDKHAFNDVQGYLQLSTMNDPQLVRFNYDAREEVFDGISYNKGGAILRYLNNLMGDAAFYKAMNIYLTKNALHSGEAHQWRLAVEEATGLDWNWFFTEWYYHSGHPAIRVNYNYNDSMQRLEATVTQTQSDSTFMFTLPLKTAVIYGSEKSIIDWNISKKKDTFIYAYKNGQKPVLIPDYTHILPGEMRDNKKPEQWLTTYLNCTDYINKRLAISAAGKSMSDSINQKIIDLALNDTNWSMRARGLMALKNTQSEKYHRRWKAKIIAMAETDKNTEVKSSAISALAAWKESSGKNVMFSYLYDSSYSLAATALDGIDILDKDTAYILAKRLLELNPRGGLDYKIWELIGKKGNDDDVALYEKYMPYKLGNEKYAMAGSMSNFMRDVKNQSTFDRGMVVFANMSLLESMKSIRTAVAGFICQYAGHLKDDTTADDKDAAETAKKRLAIVKTYMQKIIDNEQDKTAKEDMNKLMKDNFAE